MRLFPKPKSGSHDPPPGGVGSLPLSPAHALKRELEFLQRVNLEMVYLPWMLSLEAPSRFLPLFQLQEDHIIEHAVFCEALKEHPLYLSLDDKTKEVLS